MPISELYGRAQAFGQPVILNVNASLSNPSLATSGSRISINPGRTRSLSATARPHVGKATHAMLQRLSVDISSDVFTP